MRPHRALAASVARLLRECRAEVDIERTVPELIRVAAKGDVQEAVLDLVVTFPWSVQPLYIDVSVRCPHAQGHGQAVASPGEAADAAIADKRKRATAATCSRWRWGPMGGSLATRVAPWITPPRIPRRASATTRLLPDSSFGGGPVWSARSTSPRRTSTCLPSAARQLHLRRECSTAG